MNLDFLNKIRVLVVGDVMIDRYLIGTADRISGEAPVPILRVQKEEFRPGGAANVAMNLGALGVKTHLVGHFGLGKDTRRLVRALNPPISITTLGTAPTIVKTRLIAHGQQIGRFDEEAEPSEYAFTRTEDWHKMLAGHVAECDAVIISDYAKGFITQPVVDFLRGCGKFVAMDPKPKNRLDVDGLDLLTPNQEEMRQFEEAGRAPKAKNILVTMGAQGMCLNGDMWMPAESAGPVDVTGAGDTVVAIMAAALASGVPPHDALSLASKGAAVVVQKFGTATCSRAELADCF